jgi:hypothetical protein
MTMISKVIASASGASINFNVFAANTILGGYGTSAGLLER